MIDTHSTLASVIVVAGLAAAVTGILAYLTTLPIIGVIVLALLQAILWIIQIAAFIIIRAITVLLEGIIIGFGLGVGLGVLFIGMGIALALFI
jgi:hypothetical protein